VAGLRPAARTRRVSFPCGHPTDGAWELSETSFLPLRTQATPSRAPSPRTIYRAWSRYVWRGSTPPRSRKTNAPKMDRGGVLPQPKYRQIVSVG
jgi:hypothetical protein